MKNHRSVKQFDRRDVLAGFGAAAAGMASSIGPSPTKTIRQREADRAPSIRITGMKTYRVGPVLYAKIETNHGVKNLRSAQKSRGVH